MHLSTVVETASGKLQGYFTGRCLLFAGIPYAAAPVGERRFRPPEPPEPWSGQPFQYGYLFARSLAVETCLPFSYGARSGGFFLGPRGCF